MKRVLSIIVIALVAASCSSPVKRYIKKDFSRTVRENQLENEIKEETSRLSKTLSDMALDENPDAKQGQDLVAQAKKLEKEIYSRLKSYKRTGDYSYIYNIADDGEKCDAMMEKGERLLKKARPYINHKDKQIKALISAINEVDAEELMNMKDLEKAEDLTEEYIFNHVIGTPENMVTASSDEIKSISEDYLTNYFIANPTPTVKGCKYRKDDDSWFISLSDGKCYTLHAIKVGGGEFLYNYSEAEGLISGAGRDKNKKD